MFFYLGLLFVALLLLFLLRMLYEYINYPALETAILSTISEAGKISGRELRKSLRKQKHSVSGPHFYAIMAELENAELVQGWYEDKVVDGYDIHERWYRLIRTGHLVRRSTSEVKRRAARSLIPRLQNALASNQGVVFFIYTPNLK